MNLTIRFHLSMNKFLGLLRQTLSLKQTFLTEKQSSRPVLNKIKRKIILQIVTIHLSRFSRIKQIKFIITTLYFTTSTINISNNFI